MIDQLKTAAEKEKYFTLLEPEFNALKKKMSDTKKQDLQNHRGDGRRGKNEAEYLLTPGTTADAAPATVQH